MECVVDCLLVRFALSIPLPLSSRCTYVIQSTTYRRVTYAYLLRLRAAFRFLSLFRSHLSIAQMYTGHTIEDILRGVRMT